MLVPQQPICPQCGTYPASAASVCPACGARLFFPRMGQRSGSYPPVLPPAVPAPPPSFTPLVVELLLNFLGIYGVGWIMAGSTAVGIPLLICSVVLWPLVFLFALLTLGLVLLCLGPLAIVAIVCNALLLQRAIKRKSGL
jgi:hypothetical protein